MIAFRESVFITSDRTTLFTTSSKQGYTSYDSKVVSKHIEDRFWVLIGQKDLPSDSLLCFNLQVLDLKRYMSKEGIRESQALESSNIISIQLHGKSGKPIVVGTMLEKSTQKQRALFVVITPFFVNISKVQEYQEIISLYKVLDDLAPKNPMEYQFLKALNQYFKQRSNNADWMDTENLLIPCPSDTKLEKYDVPPKPIDGIEAIRKAIRIPEIEKTKGGRILLKVRIDKKGRVAQVVVIKSFSEIHAKSVSEAIQSSKWKPAFYKGEPVESEFTIPVVFAAR